MKISRIQRDGIIAGSVRNTLRRRCYPTIVEDLGDGFRDEDYLSTVTAYHKQKAIGSLQRKGTKEEQER